MSLFDSVSSYLGDSIDKLFSFDNIATTLKGAAGGAGKIDLSGKPTASLSGLDDSLVRLSTPGYKSSKTEALPSVSHDQIMNRWTERLSKFAQIERETGVKL